jgi:hypothetical protein
MSATNTITCRAALKGTAAVGAGAAGAPGPLPGDGKEGADMTARGEQVAPVWSLPKRPYKPQRDLDGRSWRIVRIEVSYCWATPYGGDSGFVRYRIEVTRSAGASRRPPQMSAEQRPLYRKIRHCGIEPAAALAAWRVSKPA